MMKKTPRALSFLLGFFFFAVTSGFAEPVVHLRPKPFRERGGHAADGSQRIAGETLREMTAKLASILDTNPGLLEFYYDRFKVIGGEPLQQEALQGLSDSIPLLEDPAYHKLFLLAWHDDKFPAIWHVSRLARAEAVRERVLKIVPAEFSPEKYFPHTPEVLWDLAGVHEGVLDQLPKAITEEKALFEKILAVGLRSDIALRLVVWQFRMKDPVVGWHSRFEPFLYKDPPDKRDRLRVYLESHLKQEKPLSPSEIIRQASRSDPAFRFYSETLVQLLTPYAEGDPRRDQKPLSRDSLTQLLDYLEGVEKTEAFSRVEWTDQEGKPHLQRIKLFPVDVFIFVSPRPWYGGERDPVSRETRLYFLGLFLDETLFSEVSHYAGRDPTFGGRLFAWMRLNVHFDKASPERADSITVATAQNHLWHRLGSLRRYYDDWTLQLYRIAEETMARLFNPREFVVLPAQYQAEVWDRAPRGPRGIDYTYDTVPERLGYTLTKLEEPFVLWPYEDIRKIWRKEQGVESPRKAGSLLPTHPNAASFFP